MSQKKLLDRHVSKKLFKPTFRRSERQSSAYIKKPENKDYKYEQFKDTNLYSTSSYRYGDKNYLVSTQQSNIDFSKFENHTFFHSAVANVNESFDRIVNFYPFDGTQKQIEEFEDTLTGFEKYVFDSFPKNVGYLNFSGTMLGEDSANGTYIEVVDRAGAAIKNISSNQSSNLILDPKEKGFTFEMFCKIPSQSNDNQIILQKSSSLANGFTLALSHSLSPLSCSLLFGISSGSNYVNVSGNISKGSFNHIAAIYDPQGDQKTKLLINDKVYSSSLTTVFKDLNFQGNSLFLGRGSNLRGLLDNHAEFIPKQTFSGSIDDLRYYHGARTKTTIEKFKRASVYAGENLKLYYKFNEPGGSHSGNNIILDSSGNSLHSTVSNYITFNRLTSSDVPVANELPKRNPILFPNFSSVKTLNSQLLTSGSEYDTYNQNLITRLIPQHYFLEGNEFDNFTNDLGQLGNEFYNFSDNNVGKKISEIPSAQLMVKFLLSWAKLFDEMKIIADTISNYRHVNYHDLGTVPDPLLRQRAELDNIILPTLFRNAAESQLIEGINLAEDYTNSSMTLNEIQNLVWRRIISDSTNIKLSKGTIDSIKSVFRSAGIEPDNIMSFREYGGSKVKSLEGSRELKVDVLKFLNFSASLGNVATATDELGYPGAPFPKLKSSYLSGSRTEVGFPLIQGSFVNHDSFKPHGISDNKSDGLFTSGSFTFEGLYDWESGYAGFPESLVRMHVTGTSAPSSTEGTITNLVGDEDKVTLFVRDSVTTNSVKTLFLSGLNIFDKDMWRVSFGRKNQHNIPGSVHKSEYFLRASKQYSGEIVEYYQTSSIFANAADSLFNNCSSYNSSGSFLIIGSQSLEHSSATVLLNDASSGNVDILAHSSSFTGMVTNILFWSKFIDETEWKAHSKNYSSVGVNNPFVNYNFTTKATGSFERLRIQTSGKQATTSSDATGKTRLFDFSQNNYHLTGTNFEVSSQVFKPLKASYEILSDKFDLNFAKTKVRIRSYQDVSLIEDFNYASSAPAYEVNPSEQTLDDNRFSIDMSVMKGLNENILSMFANFSPLDDALGRPNLIFGEKYPDLIQFRKIYFNNVIDKLDLKKYRTLFKWIDNAFTDIVYSIVPRTTNFLGINFIYESHVLERNRMKYLFDEIYLKALPRDPSRGNLLLSQFVGSIHKF